MTRPAQPNFTFGLLVGKSKPMQHIFQQIARVASGSYPVLIIGETGTGKELIARAIHQHARAQRPFVAVDCSAVPASLFETEMFGCTKGAYTGAVEARLGVIESANGGTLFLDEIGNLASGLQPKLLRALQQKEIRPVGANFTRQFAARVIAATNIDIEEAVQGRTFRCDLFHRLNVVQLRVLPLRHRPEDIRPLAESFVRQYTDELQVTRSISEEGKKRLERYDWPGNVRELQNVVARAIVLEEGPLLEFRDFNDFRSAKLATNQAPLSLETLERQAILGSLQRTGGCRALTARNLGIGSTTLYIKLKKYANAWHVTAPKQQGFGGVVRRQCTHTVEPKPPSSAVVRLDKY